MNEENHDSAGVSDDQDKIEFDPSKLLEMAKLFSTLMADDKDEVNDKDKINDRDEAENGTPNQNNKKSNENNIFQMLEMAKLFSNLMGNTNNRNQTQESPPVPVGASSAGVYPPSSILFDETIHTPQMKVIKAAIPYMEPSHQKILGVFIKSLELKKVLDIYNHNTTPLSAESLTSHPHWKMDMLTSIRPHCSEEKQYMVDMITKVMDIGELIKKIQTLKPSEQTKDSSAPSSNPNQKQMLLQALSPMLDEKQKQMLTMFSTLLDNR